MRPHRQLAESDQQRGRARHQHVRAEARRPALELALVADQPAQQHRDRHAGNDVELLGDAGVHPGKRGRIRVMAG
jgi:hypothetical protein